MDTLLVQLVGAILRRPRGAVTVAKRQLGIFDAWFLRRFWSICQSDAIMQFTGATNFLDF
jgi:hypothetical protein